MTIVAEGVSQSRRLGPARRHRVRQVQRRDDDIDP
jgi:hypothetical protein